jgi:hypothetical protein
MHVSRRSSNTGLSSALRTIFVELPSVASWQVDSVALLLSYLLRPLSGCGDMVVLIYERGLASYFFLFFLFYYSICSLTALVMLVVFFSLTLSTSFWSTQYV